MPDKSECIGMDRCGGHDKGAKVSKWKRCKQEKYVTHRTEIGIQVDDW